MNIHNRRLNDEWIEDYIKKWEPHKNIDIEKIRTAIALAIKSHGMDKRKSGELYIHHPFRVADRVADIFPDTLAINGAILHDTIEDTKLSQQDIVDALGKETSDLVRALTKVKDNDYMTFERILKYGLDDVRVILIKLMDRLDNLSDLHVFDRKKQIRIANESVQYYAELARVLGINEAESQLRDMCFKIRSPKQYQKLEEKIRSIKERTRPITTRVIEDIKNIIAPNILSRVEVLEIKPHEFMPPQKLEFDLPLRITLVVNKPDECYTAMGLLHIHYRCVPLSIRDYISNPKSTGWQGLISEIFIDNKKVTVTFLSRQHWINNRFGVIYALSLQNYQKSFYQKFIGFCLNILKNQIQHSEKNIKRTSLHPKDDFPFKNSDTNFEELRLSDLFKYINTEEIQTQSPRGKIITTANNATILDFAFAINPKIGLHCYGGEINGVLYPPETILREGNIINIITKDTITPTKDWKFIAVSPKARKEITRYLIEHPEETTDSETQTTNANRG